MATTVTIIPPKRAFAPLYSQRHGLALDAPSRFANRFAYAVNFNNTDELIEHFDPLFAANATMTKRLYGTPDGNTGKATNHFGNYTLVEFDKISHFYDYSRQFMSLVPDAIFQVLQFQSMQTRRGVVINVTFDQKGTITQPNIQITFDATNTDATFEGPSSSSSTPVHLSGEENSPSIEGDYYNTEATALLAEMEEDDTLVNTSIITTTTEVMDEEQENRKIAMITKPMHASGILSMHLNDEGKIQHMEFFYQFH